jgi:hypothetical protein
MGRTKSLPGISYHGAGNIHNHTAQTSSTLCLPFFCLSRQDQQSPSDLSKHSEHPTCLDPSACLE